MARAESEFEHSGCCLLGHLLEDELGIHYLVQEQLQAIRLLQEIFLQSHHAVQDIVLKLHCRPVFGFGQLPAHTLRHSRFYLREFQLLGGKKR